VTLKVKYNDFELISRSVTKENSIKNVDDISQLLKELLKKTQVGTRKVRLLGVSVSKLESFNELITEQGTGDDQLILI
jgi:DNA polymerase IV